MSHPTSQVFIIHNKPRRVERELTDTFVFRKDRKHHWLQRLCCYVLGRIGAFQNVTYITYTRVVLDSAPLAKHLMDQYHIVRSEMSGGGPLHVLIGPDDFEELWHAEYQSGGISRFGLGAHVGINGRHTIMDMEVTVVPWMKGILIVPKDK